MLMPGFFGGDERGKTMSLGRGGSDYSAARRAMDAELLEIWTDVDGIYSADPRLVGGLPLAEVSFEEAMELAYFGARCSPEDDFPRRERSIPVRVCNSFREHPGTLSRTPRRRLTAVRGLSSSRTWRSSTSRAGLRCPRHRRASLRRHGAHRHLRGAHRGNQRVLHQLLRAAVRSPHAPSTSVEFEVEREAGKVILRLKARASSRCSASWGQHAPGGCRGHVLQGLARWSAAWP